MIRKTTLVRLLFVVPLLAAGIALGAPSPAAAALVCNDPSQQFDVTYKGNVVVPANGVCDLYDALIRGSVTAEPGAIVNVVGSEVRGSIVATNPATFVLIQTVVRGSVTATGSASSATVSSSEVRGDVVLTDIVGASIGTTVIFVDTVVRGNATVSRNAVSPGAGIDISLNTIAGNLICEGNSPDPMGGSNSVGGVRTGQCASH